MVDGESVAQGARDIAAVTSTTEVAILPPVAGGSLVRAAVLTVSDRASSGAHEDKSGPALVAMLQEAGYAIAATAVVPDDKKRIAAQVQTWCDASVDLVITTGGTGIASRDVTPEALTPLLTRELPGIVETMRAVGRAETPLADLSRQVAGTRDATLVLGVPGSIRGATTSLTAVLAVIPHALEMLQGNPE